MTYGSPFRIQDLVVEARAVLTQAREALRMMKSLGVREALIARDAKGESTGDTQALNGVSLVDALLLLLSRANVGASRQGLLAALPMVGDDLDPRVASLALARFQVQATWQKRAFGDLAPGDFPCVLRLDDGAFVVALGPIIDARVLIDAGGGEEMFVSPTELARRYAGDALLCGSADPVNGDVDHDEQEAMRKSPRLWILRQFMNDRRLLTHLCLAAVLINLCALAMPIYQRAIYDRVVPNLAMESLWAVSIGILIALAFEFMLRNVKADFVEAAGLRVSHLVQHKVIVGVLGARSKSASTNSGEMIVALRDIDGLAYLAPLAIVTFMIDLPFFFICIALLWLMGGPLALVALLGAIVIVFVGCIAASALGRTGQRASNLSRARMNQIVDAVDGLKTLKANQAEGKFLKEWSLVSDHAAMAGHAQRQWGEWSNSAIGLAVQSVTVMIMIAGVYQMANGAMTIGALIACSLIAGRALTPIATATAILGRAHQALAQFAGLAQLIALPPESDAPKASIVQGQLRGAMEFRRVSFAYEDGGRPVLNDVSLSIRLGERVAVIGKSGSGKSTLLQLASALVQPTQGAILYDGFAADQYGVSRVRAGISFASQDAIVFDATLKENILLGVHAARDEDIALALRISGADQVAASLAEGFGTKLGHRGAHLSGGQRQQVLLARALVRAAPFLILDEPTSALDAGAEARIRDGLQSLPRDRTLIISTHRMELLSAVDRVIWLEEGRIIADQPAAAVIQRLRGAPSSPVAQSTVKAS